jgi:DNA-binding GntR family transcriptional regulator
MSRKRRSAIIGEQSAKPAESERIEPGEAGSGEGISNLTDMAYRKIKAMMMNYDIVPGQRLIFVDLAKRLGVSRTPVNSALGILAAEGFLDFVPNQGYTVHEITHHEARNLYELRKILEMGAIEKVIERVTPEKLELLQKRQNLYEKAILDNISRGRFALDQEFHAAYIQMADNPYLTSYFREIYQRIFLRHRIEGLRPGRAKEVVSEHKALFEAIRQRDVKRARNLIEQHIDAGEKYIFTAVPD